MTKRKVGKAVKVLWTVLSVLILLIGGAYGYYFLVTRGPLPQVEGELRVPGLKESVEVIRDSYGIPNIYAKNLEDLFFAQGYVQAQDRWWQMEFFRKTCGGRIGELTGRKAAWSKRTSTSALSVFIVWLNRNSPAAHPTSARYWRPSRKV